MIVKTDEKEKSFSSLLWKVTVILGFLVFFLYGLSFFLSPPSFQPTPSPVLSTNANDQNLKPINDQTVKFKYR